MIRADDFSIEIQSTAKGVCVEVTHLPTGNQRVAEAVLAGEVAKARDSLVSELKRLLFQSEDVRFSVGRSEGGDFLSVKHLPSGIERSAMRNESSHEELLDAVLEELFSGEDSGHTQRP